MKTGWKITLGAAGAAAVAWLGAETCEKGGERPPKPPVSDTDRGDQDAKATADISHAVRDRLRQEGAVRPRPHFVPPLPPREPLELNGPENLAEHMGTTRVDKATQATIVRAIFGKARCAKKGSAAYEECRDEKRRRIHKEGNPDAKRKMLDGYIAGIADDPECEAKRLARKNECLREERKKDPDAHETEEHYFLAQGAESLAGLEEAVRNNTPIGQMELQRVLQDIQLLIMQPGLDGILLGGEEEKQSPHAALEKILGSAGLSIPQFVEILTTIQNDHIPPDEKNDPENDQEWDPAKEPPPPSPEYTRGITERLLEIAREQE